MAVGARLLQAPIISLLILIILNGMAIPVDADDIPDSIDVIQGYLPDSISLDGKVVYVDFWASWCVPCRQSFPWMMTIYDDLRSKGFEIIAVNVDKDHQAAGKFLDEFGSDFPIIYDSTGGLAEQYGLEAMPTSFIYDKEGQLVSQHIGFHQEETGSIRDSILQYLGERGAR